MNISGLREHWSNVRPVPWFEMRRSRLLEAWGLVVMVATVFASVEIPLRLALGYEVTGLLLFADWVVTVLFAIDIWVQFNTPKKHGAHVITDRKEIARDYLRSWFLIDLIATIPFDLLIPGGVAFSGRIVRILRLLRLARVLRVVRLYAAMRRWLHSYAINPSLMRLFFFLFWVTITTHWIACGWLALRGLESHPNGATAYLHALYWAMTTLTTVGYGDITPENVLEVAYTMVVLLVGVGVYAFVIGNIANILRHADVSRGTHVARVSGVREFMKERGIPDEIRERVLSYYAYLWETKMGQEEASILSDLPPSLRAEIALYLNQRIVERIPLFSNVPPGFVRALVSRLSHAVYTPGDHVIRVGEIGDEMYLINRGRVEVLSADEEELATLGDGDYFGEMSLLYSEPRAATIRAVDYCDFYVIDRATFERVLNAYPAVAEQLSETASRRRDEVDRHDTDSQRL